MSRYKTLRTWSAVLIVVGIFSVVSASIGVFAWAVEADGFWQTMGVILFGAPVVILLATWPIATGQALRALADIGDSVGPTATLESSGLEGSALGSTTI
jgi:Zn-dependent membrane protease YugP